MPTRMPSVGALAAPRLRASPFAARQLDGRLFELRVGGVLPDDWSLVFAGDCARRGHSLMRGYVRRELRGHWRGRLEIELAAASAGDAAPLPGSGGRALRPPWIHAPHLLDFELEESHAFGGALELEVHAWEAVGLLYGVLSAAASLDLVAVELTLETEGDCAFHRLALVDRHRTPVSSRRRRALARRLAAPVPVP